MNAINVPLYYGPSKDDRPVDGVKKALDKKGKLGKKCQYHGFVEQGHGFCAARGDWKDAKVKKDVDNVLKETTAFFKKHL